jgi:DNA-binding GntR family transcriptional regulator
MTTALPAHIRQEFDRGQRREAIVRLLLADIFQGRYRAGQKLVTQELAVRCGVSHTPIREALIALAGIGVVDLLPNRGAAVRQVTVRDIREVCQLRRALECQAVRSACGHVDRRELAALAAEFDRLAASSEKLGPRAVDRARRLDSRLHDLIAASCGNTLLGRELNRLKLLFRAFRDVAWEYHGKRHRYHRVVEEAAEHQAIVAALLADDRRAAHLAMSRHVRSGMKYWSRAVAGGIVEKDGTGRKNGMKVIGMKANGGKRMV